MPFNQSLFDFKKHLQVAGRSPATIEIYVRMLKLFFIYLKDLEIQDIKKVNRQVIKDYQLALARNKDSVSTTCVKVRAVKRFFEYLSDSNRILINPAEFIKEPKKERTLPRVVLTRKETALILDQPNLSTLTGIRDRALLEVLYSTGIRREEACKLTIYDADLQGGLLRVNKGKGSKDRVVPLGKHAVRFLREYIQKIRPRFTRKNRGNRKLFVKISGGDLSKAMVTLLVRTYAKQAKIKKKVTPHTFRHTFATELLRNGADIRAVQKMMGHSNLSVTQIYTRVAGLEVKKTHAKHHPGEREKITKEEFKPQITRIKGEYKRDRPDDKIQGAP